MVGVVCLFKNTITAVESYFCSGSGRCPCRREERKVIGKMRLSVLRSGSWSLRAEKLQTQQSWQRDGGRRWWAGGSEFV